MNSQQSHTSTSAILRPRNRRPVSVDHDFETLPTDSTSRSNIHGCIPSPSTTSRVVSPIPSPHPSRSPSTARTSSKSQLSSSHAADIGWRGSLISPDPAPKGLWETSWSSLQGIASDLLGSDTLGIFKDTPSDVRPRRRRTLETTYGWNASHSGPAKWGPSGSLTKHIASGSQEDRLAQVQARKMETMLTANDHYIADANGRYKRRTSEERESASASPTGHEARDTLVYLHHVQPSDTLAGVAIKYNCSPAVFRKTNRLWPNDTIQIRKVAFLPVDACGVRGRKVPEAPDTTDTPEHCKDDDNIPVPTPGTLQFKSEDRDQASNRNENPQFGDQSSPSHSGSTSDSPPWNHDSWVSIDSFPNPVEIARLPRQTLGFFPPSRRKSVVYTDLDTPPASLDIPRNLGPATSPVRHPMSRTRQTNHRVSASHFASTLSGPGGVGTLNKGVVLPGPAHDKLNQLFAPHLPSVAPRSSFESVTSTSSTGIEIMGGAIEGWVRKLAGKAAAAVQTPPLGGIGGVGGDLIELVEGWELESGSRRGGRSSRAPENGRARSAGALDIGGGEDGGLNRYQDRDGRLRERFPVRGRVFQEQRNRGTG